MPIAPPHFASLSSQFTTIDWIVLILYLVIVSVLGVALAGKQTDMEGFFRGGNRLPWYAVSASMIATIISAVTFVAVPSVAYKDGGNFSYLQFGIIAGLLSRLFVSFVLVPAYYKHRVYSPYDYMGQRLGEAARSVTTALFSLMGLLAQASRVYLTAIILELLMKDQLATASNALGGIDTVILSVSLVGGIAIVWTMLGGIATVIWTDAMLFLVFVVGGLIAIGVVATEIPGGLGDVIRLGWDAGKFKLWTLGDSGASSGVEFSSRLGAIFASPYTLWAAIIAVTFGNIGAYGTDQLLAQRIFTCRSQRDAKLAVMSSYAGELVVALMLLVGVGLWAFYNQFPERLVGESAVVVADKPDNIFPVFILNEVPVVLRGLIVAGIFAAAISSLTSILAALSQTTLSALYLPLVGLSADEPIPPERNAEVLRFSRVLIVIWGIALCAMAVAIDRYVQAQKAAGSEVYFLDLALGLANYVLGTLFATFLLAWLPTNRNAYGLIWSAPLSVFCVVAARFHSDWTITLCIVVTSVLIVTWVLAAFANKEQCFTRLGKTPILAVGCGLLFVLTQFLWFSQVELESGELLMDANGIKKIPIAWPWYAPIGGTVAFVFGYLLGESREGKGVSK